MSDKRKHWREVLADAQRAHAENPYPAGKLTDDDQGALAVVIAALDGKIVIHFGKLVLWIAMRPEEADAMAAKLTELGRDIRAGES